MLSVSTAVEIFYELFSFTYILTIACLIIN